MRITFLLIFIWANALNYPSSAQRLMNSNRATVGYIEEGRVMNSFRSTIGYVKEDRVLNFNRATIGYYEDVASSHAVIFFFFSFGQ